VIIDLHTHLLDYGHWPDEWWDYVAREWATKQPGRKPEQIRGRIEEGLVDSDGSRMVSHMDAAGIDKAVILPIDWGPSFHSRCSLEKMVSHAADCAKRYPQRLIPFAGIDPRRDRAADTLAAWLTSGVFKGLKLYPNCGFYPDDDCAMPIYEMCLEHDAPILFHTGHPLPLLDAKYSRPEYFRRVVEAFPRLKVIFGHAGAPHNWQEMLELVEASQEAVLELSVCLWHDSDQLQELQLVRRIADARDRVGIQRIVFGTDHVSGARVRPPGFLETVARLFKRMPETAQRAGVRLTHEENAMIMGGNASRLLRLNQSRAVNVAACPGSIGEAVSAANPATS
jgi:predicted TIM-barrel fold metal-dependent hydrolase